MNEKNKCDLLSLLSTYKKMEVEKLSKETYGIKSYLKSMNLDEARTFFSARGPGHIC